jgi:transposase-like protein
MAPKKSKKPKPSPGQIAAAELHWAQLEAQLDREMPILHESRLQVGRILYHMKRWLKQWGLNKGRRGRWDATCQKHGIDRKSAENWIRLYQEQASIPAEERVVQPTKPRAEKSQQDSENNPVRVTGLVQPSVTPAEEEDHDYSTDQRLGIECIFVLTMNEKRKFMAAVQALGPLIATQEMYKAVIAKAEGAPPQAEGVGA